MAPWTAAQAASDEVSKKMLIEYLQKNADQAFLSAHKAAGQPNAVAKRVTKDQLVEAYKKLAGLEGGAARFPTAATCSRTLFVPPCDDAPTLHERLACSLAHAQTDGFGYE